MDAKTRINHHRGKESEYGVERQTETAIKLIYNHISPGIKEVKRQTGGCKKI